MVWIVAHFEIAYVLSIHFHVKMYDKMHGPMLLIFQSLRKQAPRGCNDASNCPICLFYWLIDWFMTMFALLFSYFPCFWLAVLTTDRPTNYDWLWFFYSFVFSYLSKTTTMMMMITSVLIIEDIILVHDRIYNSVADYNSSRVGVGCMSPFHVHDGIIFQCGELEG